MAIGPIGLIGPIYSIGPILERHESVEDQIEGGLPLGLSLSRRGDAASRSGR